MDAFRVEFEIIEASGEASERVEALVDTGATHTWIPRSQLERLGYQSEDDWEFVLADGREVTYGMGWIRIRFDGRVQPTPVIFSDDGSEPLLGVVTLEELRLGVDAVNRRLVPTPGLLKGLRA
jgi:clan AA aspartic protease